MSVATGWAVTCSSEAVTILFVNSVSDTRRGALVRFIIDKTGLPVWNTDSDEHIEELWQKLAPAFSAEVHSVTIIRSE